MKLTFEQWMKAVDEWIGAKVGFGITSADLPDVCYADWYADGITAKSAACKAIKYANEN